MSFEEAVRPRRRPKYDGEDNSVTSNRELMGWYAYAVAAEVFAVCGVGSFLPVILEQLARERGVFWSDKSTPCVPKPGSEKPAGGLLTRAENERNEQCIVKPFGSEITTASFAMYTFSLAVLVQAIALISFSSFADHGPYRKKLLLIFAWTGATMSMLFLFITPSVYVLGSLLVIIGVTCLGSSFTLLNSFLPLLVSNHPEATPKASLSHVRRTAYESEGKPDAELQLSARISSKGVGIGYTAAVFVQSLSILVLFALSKTSVSKMSPSIPLRLVIFLVGAWWAGFSIPTALWLRARPGPPLDDALSSRRTYRSRSVFTYISFAWGSMYKTLRTALRLRQATIFLIAWFLLSDAIATVSGTAILFARTELHMSTVPIALLSITATSFGIVGAFAWPRLSRRFNLQTNHTIIACILLMEIIPVYGLLGYLPFIKKWGVGGIQQQWEIFPMGAVHGFVMGGISSYCRSFFGFLVPPGSEAAFYALYAVTDKGSSAVGPAIVGKIVDKTGTIRPAFAFLAVLVSLPAPLIWWVDVEKGREDAAVMAEKLRGETSGYEGVREFELASDSELDDLGSETEVSDNAKKHKDDEEEEGTEAEGLLGRSV